MTRRIQTKLLIVTSLIPALSLAGLTVVFSSQARDGMGEAFEQRLALLRESVVAEMGLAVRLGSAESMQATLERIRRDPAFAGLVVLDPFGGELLHEPAGLELPPALEEGGRSTLRHRSLHWARQEMRADDGQGLGTILIAFDRSPLREQLRARLGWGALLSLAVLLLGGLLASFVARRLVAPLPRIAEAAERARAGDLSARAPQVVTGDELEHLASSIAQLLDQMRQDTEAIAAKAEQLGAISTQVEDASSILDEASARATRESGEASESSRQLGLNIENIAERSRELSDAAGGVATNCSSVKDLVDRAVATAGESEEAVERLGSSSTRITRAVEVIRSVAEQTNLLALNATIEAARAGTAGRGFAVVAGEVKSLAGETNHATAEIAQMVEELRGDALTVIEAISGIRDLVAEVGGLHGGLMELVERQHAASEELSRHLQEAVRGNGRLAERIEGSRQEAQSVAGVATDVREVAAGLGHASRGLHALLARYQGA